MPLIKTHDRVRLLKGEFSGTVGWVQRIEVEPTTELLTRVLLTIELSRPYGQTIQALPSMVELDHYEPPALMHAA